MVEAALLDRAWVLASAQQPFLADVVLKARRRPSTSDQSPWLVEAWRSGACCSGTPWATQVDLITCAQF